MQPLTLSKQWCQLNGKGKKLWSVCLEILNTSFIASEEWRCEKLTTVGSVSLFLGSFIIKTKRMGSVGLLICMNSRNNRRKTNTRAHAHAHTLTEVKWPCYWGQTTHLFSGSVKFDLSSGLLCPALDMLLLAWQTQMKTSQNKQGMSSILHVCFWGACVRIHLLIWFNSMHFKSMRENLLWHRPILQRA